jgi:hypothetical protein
MHDCRGFDRTDFVTERHESVGNTLVVGPCNRGQYENGEKVDEAQSHDDSSVFIQSRSLYNGVASGVVVQNRTT